MKVLLIGGAGFIGSRTALRLLKDGHDPIVLDSLDLQVHGADIARSETLRQLWSDVPVVVGDTRNRASLAMLMTWAEAVYYFPACTGTGQSMYQIERYSDVNVRGASVFAELLAERRDSIRRVVVSSSRAVYGEGSAICTIHGRINPDARAAGDLASGNFDNRCPECHQAVAATASMESDPAKPVSIYGITKLAQEQIIGNVCGALDIPAVMFRYQNVYGPGQSLNNSYTGILSIFSQLLLAGRKINLFEDGLPTRDFVYIDDVVEYNVRALTADVSGVNVMNLGSSIRATLVDLVRTMGDALRIKPDYFVSGQYRMGDIRNAVSDNDRLQRILGGREFVPLEEGVARFVRWVRDQGPGGDACARFDRSLMEMRSAGLLRAGAR